MKQQAHREPVARVTPARQGRSSRRPVIVPPQHGAWAFLGLPILLGFAASGFTWLTLVLAAGFVLAYPTSYFAIAVLRYPRPELYRRGLVTWGLPAIAIAIVVLIARPWMVWIGLAYAIGFAINLGFAKARNERSLINDAVFIIECVAITPVIWACTESTGGVVPPSPVSAPSALWALTAMGGLALIGSTLHVRSLIRERRNESFRRASQVFAIASLLAAIVLAVPYGGGAVASAICAFGYLTARAFFVGRRPLRPGIIGVFELVGFITVFGVGVVICAS